MSTLVKKQKTKKLLFVVKWKKKTVGQCVQEALYIYRNSGYLWAEVEVVFEKKGLYLSFSILLCHLRFQTSTHCFFSLQKKMNIFNNSVPRKLVCPHLANSNTAMCTNDRANVSLFERKLKGEKSIFSLLCTLVKRGHLIRSYLSYFKAFLLFKLVCEH